MAMHRKQIFFDGVLLISGWPLGVSCLSLVSGVVVSFRSLRRRGRRDGRGRRGHYDRKLFYHSLERSTLA